MKRFWIITVAAVVLVAVIILLQKQKKSEPQQEGTVSKVESQSYWTCPMHPQVHTEHPGECPICHMKLVQVKAKPQGGQANQGENRAVVQATQDQLALTGTQKTEVEKMSLKVKIPVSGRFISSSYLAFQIYESDLRYVKPGLSFKGASSFYPEDEVTGTISSVDSIVDPTSRTVRIVGSVKNGARGVPSETGFRGEIEFMLRDRIAIPESSVLHTGSGDLVYVFANGDQLNPRTVKLGLKSEGFYDVLDGVNVGETISSGPNFLIDSESKIRAISMPEEGAEPGKSSKPSCPKGQHWDIPMSMCMPGEG
jgi:multidrug efflux pump subunit AcrA (membrane-fusion protein)